MNKKLSAALVCASALGIAYAGACGLTFYEIMHRKATIPGKMWENMSKKNDSSNGGEVKEKSSAEILIDEKKKWMKEQDFEDHTIISKRGTRLNGYYLPADDENCKRFALCSHGYRSRGKGDFKVISKFYHDNGFNLFLVDHQAGGESEGSYIGFGSYESEDLLQWVNYLVDTFGDDIEIILHGISMGSATVMLLSGNSDLPDNVKFTVADCGYTSVEDEFCYHLDNLHLPKKPIIKTVDLFNNNIAGYRFTEVSPLEKVKTAQVPILFIHGGKDTFVPTSMVYRLYDACTADKDLLVVPGAGHGESYNKNSEIYEEKLNSFIEKYL